MRLSELATGERGVVVRHLGDKAFSRRLLEMGFVPGEEVLVVKNAPLLDPVEYRIMGYDVALRRSEAADIEVQPVGVLGHSKPITEGRVEEVSGTLSRSEERVVRVAFVGNPNCGKTSLFNAASGAHEHVANYSGVTVEAKYATYKQAGYTFLLTDLPGTYSLSSYSPEERFVMEHLLSPKAPDVIINVVDATNLERNLYLTTQLMEMSLPMVMALNMHDELEQSSSVLHEAQLSELLGMAIVPTVGRRGEGVEALFAEVIELYEHRSEVRRVIDVRYRERVETAVKEVEASLLKEGQTERQRWRPRFVALKLLEGSLEAYQPVGSNTEAVVQRVRQNFEESAGLPIEEEITAGRYGFVRGALEETYEADFSEIKERNSKIDFLLTHKVWGFPIFILFMYLMFQLTFSLGNYPMEWIEAGVGWIGDLVGSLLAEGPLKDLLVDGIIGGVGGVLVFLPNIVILYLCIAIMEDTGYLSRAVFIMDRLMHGLGLHGKSFIPLLMGFGCSVPAVMATRTIESRNNRILTMLIVPFMSCSARLPVYLLLAGAFFPNNAGTVLFLIYLTGVLLAIITALLLKKVLFTKKEPPFVMELPPYRVPTPRSVLLHMWQKAKQYLHKMGSVILVASIAIWALSYFPQIPAEGEEGHLELYQQYIAHHSDAEVATFAQLSPQQQHNMLQQEYSLIGRLGHQIEPIFKWHGYDWRMSVALLTGVAAKEVVVSTMGVLYTGDAEGEAALPERLKVATHHDGSPIFTPAVAISFMIFVLVYFPCIATMVAIARESGSWWWALFSLVYTLVLAWVLGLVITQAGSLIL